MNENKNITVPKTSQHVKIIQLLKTENDYAWQGRLLGLDNNGVTYEYDTVSGVWRSFIPALDMAGVVGEVSA